MSLRGTRRAAAAVTPGPAAQKNNDITGVGIFTDHIVPGSRTHYRTDLQSFCGIVGMVDLVHQAGGKPNLVAVGAVPLGRPGHDLSLGKLSFHRLLQWSCGIRCTCYTHCLVYIPPPGERIADGAAKTGGSAAKGFDLRRMVVCLIFKEHQPLLCLRAAAPVDLHRNDDRAGIDLIGFFHILQFTFRPELFHTKKGDIHQGDILVLPALIHFFMGFFIGVKGIFDGFRIISLFKGDIF